MPAPAVLAVQPAAAPAQSDPNVGPASFGRPVIQGFATHGPLGPRDEFIKIMNPSLTEEVDISDWLVSVSDCTGRTLQIIPIPPGIVLPPLTPAWSRSPPGYSTA